MSEAAIHLRMARIEVAQLLQLVEDFRELIAGRDRSDPAIARLTPDAYPDDQTASQVFGDATRDDLLDRRAVDAEIVRTALTPFRANSGTLTAVEASVQQEIPLRADDVDPWIRTLAALRLVVAARLDITDEDPQDADDPRYGVYDWLAYRLEVIVQAADSLS